METTTVFKSNQTQAVRLPKAVALPDSVRRVNIIKLGDSRLITPAGKGWDSWFDSLSQNNDFMLDREQPEDQERDSF